jgi:hypothetical protein
MSVEQDREAILAVHRAWWKSNHGNDIELMRTAFPAGDAFLQYNLSGHPYYSRDELTRLWEHYKDQILVENPVLFNGRLELDGNMAWIACEGRVDLHATGAEGTAAVQLEAPPEPVTYRFRSTEIYHRDDGEGNAEWRMWHFHCSLLAPEDEPRPAFGDTVRSRGTSAAWQAT